jgi:AcrR family transcriptional regulator
MIDSILAAARAVMREEGVAALNLNEVARRVRVRPQSLYEYFPSKTALYDALFLLGTRMVRERIDRLRAEHEPGWDLLRGLFELRLGFAYEHPELHQLVFDRPVPGFHPSSESMEESYALRATGGEILAEVIAAGAVASHLNPDRARDLLLAMMHGLTALHMANEPELLPGAGRFGALIPEAVDVFRTAWEPAYHENQEGGRMGC